MRKKVLTILLMAVMLLASCGSESGNPINLEEETGILSGTSETYGIVEVTADKESYNRFTGELNLANDRVNYRPICISVNNIIQCLPQRGLSQCDILIEIETEAGITRTMALYADTRDVELVGSVRSLRNQFMELLYPFDPIIVHIGTSIFADAAIAENNLRTIDANVFRTAIWQDRSRLDRYREEHTYFTSASLIETAIDKMALRTESDNMINAFNFVEGGTKTTPSSGTCSRITWMFSPGYDGDFRYDEESGMYEAWQHGEERYDANNMENLEFENVFVVIVSRDVYPGSESYAGGLPRYDYTTGGTAYYVSNGSYEKCIWLKGDYSTRLSFYYGNEEDLVNKSRHELEEIPINTGRSYIAIVRSENLDTVEIED
ncbi:MAG: DUF3048 domain-containing protein [Oscillospiraceae bacterium]|nr:DUF3048 domain-containing protein [Oscillospiraceae bacterium]MBR0450923.1 DUF3048 domain-containing protein [Oscillospiraceae bacterium]